MGYSGDRGAFTRPKIMLEEEMNKENWLLGKDEPIEFEKQPVEVNAFMKITAHCRGLRRVYLNLLTNNQKMSTCNRLDLKTI